MRPDEREARLEAIRLAVEVYRVTLPHAADSTSLRGEVLTLAKSYLDFIENDAPMSPPVVVNVSGTLTAGAAADIGKAIRDEIRKGERRRGAL